MQEKADEEDPLTISFEEIPFTVVYHCKRQGM
jgi:hypothetical protein